MADMEHKAEDTPKREAILVTPTEMPLVPPSAAQPARPRVKSGPKRLAKGQRKHIRRQKQAGEIKITDRRR